MIFENRQIELTQLPQVEDLDFTSLEKAYLKVSYFGTTLFYLLLLIPLSGLYFSQIVFNIPYLAYLIPFIWSVLLILNLWLNRKNYLIKGYALRANDIVYKSGILFFSVTTIPFNRVQHCEIKQGPIQRYFGLNTLEVYTAGGQSSDLVISGLEPERARKLKEYIINKIAIEEDEPEA